MKVTNPILRNLYFSIKGLTLFIIVFSSLNSCTKDPIPERPVETDSIADIDGNMYTVVKIGDDWWMAENLATTTYRNGVAIERFQNNAQNWESGSPAYCIYEESQLAPGLLYNWAAVNSINELAPAGWHVATDAEWQEMESHLGMSTDELEKFNWRESGSCGNKLKVKGPDGWLSFEGIWGTNESGFSALAGACRLWNGQWGNPGLSSSGFWWTETKKDSSSAYFRNLDYKKSGVFRFYTDKRYGMSVRCVKDK
jgi:uncharacterized protein (TIGR02145 family)